MMGIYFDEWTKQEIQDLIDWQERHRNEWGYCKGCGLHTHIYDIAPGYLCWNCYHDELESGFNYEMMLG